MLTYCLPGERKMGLTNRTVEGLRPGLAEKWVMKDGRPAGESHGHGGVSARRLYFFSG